MNPGMVWVRFGNNSTQKARWRASGHFCLFPWNLEQSGDVTTNAVGFVEEVLAIAQRLLRVLVDGPVMAWTCW
jgi:hypothetical protein